MFLNGFRSYRHTDSKRELKSKGSKIKTIGVMGNIRQFLVLFLKPASPKPSSISPEFTIQMCTAMILSTHVACGLGCRHVQKAFKLPVTRDMQILWSLKIMPFAFLPLRCKHFIYVHSGVSPLSNIHFCLYFLSCHGLLLPFLFFYLFILRCMSAPHVCLCMNHLHVWCHRATRSWNCSYRVLWAPMSGLGARPMSSDRAASALLHWVISPAPYFYLLTS